MNIRKRDAITIAKRLLNDKKKAKHLLQRISRYENKTVDVNNDDEVLSFLTDYISSSNTYFSYFKIDIHRNDLPDLPEYISHYIKHINKLIERRNKSNHNKWALPFFAKKEDLILIPPKTFIYMYIINDRYTLVACMEIKGKMSLNLIPTFNRIFDFNSITFLSFDDTSNYIMNMMDDNKLKTFNKVMEQLLYSFSEQNDFYDDMMLQDEFCEQNRSTNR